MRSDAVGAARFYSNAFYLLSSSEQVPVSVIGVQ